MDGWTEVKWVKWILYLPSDCRVAFNIANISEHFNSTTAQWAKTRPHTGNFVPYSEWLTESLFSCVFADLIKLQLNYLSMNNYFVYSKFIYVNYNKTFHFTKKESSYIAGSVYMVSMIFGPTMGLFVVSEIKKVISVTRIESLIMTELGYIHVSKFVNCKKMNVIQSCHYSLAAPFNIKQTLSINGYVFCCHQSSTLQVYFFF